MKNIINFGEEQLNMSEQIYKNALIIKSTGSWYQVQTDDNQRIDCRIPGKFRTKGLAATNPVAVGDLVDIQIEKDQQTGIIIKLHERKNYIIRRSVNLSKQVQILAANLDQAILLVTLASPPTSFGFIDRFLITAEAYHIPPILVFNKLDLFTDEGLEVLEDFKRIYESLGYRCLEISAKERIHIDTIKQLLENKVSLVAGHSGAGKSTLINQLLPELELRTTPISSWSDKGKHTTTFAEMFPFPSGGYVIDTPGIRELGIVDIELDELAHYFPEFRTRLPQCKFYNCRHINEPGCAVLKALEQGEIAESRYLSYLSIYHGNETRA